MSIRKIVKIDEEKCNGCGQCIPNCAEGALKIVEGKARLIADIYCDGLGACLGTCPMDAIEVIEREADEFDEEAVEKFLAEQKNENEQGTGGGGCPGSMLRQFDNPKVVDEDVRVSSKLRQWPVQLSLVPTNAPYFKKADLLITADCVPFAYANYHNDFLKDKALVVGCPKLDDSSFYIKKLEELIKNNDLESICVLIMEVPCCSGMSFAAKTARDNSGVNKPLQVITVGLQGDIVKREYI